MTHLLRDIVRQPAELQRTLELLTGKGKSALDRAAAAIRGASRIYLTGLGSSWHAALAAGALFQRSGRPAYLLEASELLHFSSIPEDSVLIVISRTGRSAEIVSLLP